MSGITYGSIRQATMPLLFLYSDGPKKKHAGRHRRCRRSCYFAGSLSDQKRSTSPKTQIETAWSLILPDS